MEMGNVVEVLLKYVVNEAYILIPVMWVLGWLLKNTPIVADWVIPWLLLAFGIAGAMGIIGFTMSAVLQGVVVAGVAVMTHQLYKQTVEKRTE